jgi:hypothetical protein
LVQLYSRRPVMASINPHATPAAGARGGG